MKLREYLSMGKPVACNDLGDLSYFKDVTHQCKTGDIKDFAKKMEEALQAGENKEGRNFVIKNCSWRPIIKRMKERFEELLA